MIDYIDQPCPLCGKHMHEGDDIVVCPECATPQHRECWMSEGHCVNKDKHSPDFVWEPRKTASVFDEAAESGETVTCRACGKENPAGALHCGGCGNLLEPEKESNLLVCPFCGAENTKENKVCDQCGAPLIFENRFFTQNIYMRGVNMPEDEPIGFTTAGEAALYVQSSAKRYLPKFKRISLGRFLSFNWAAFLFAPWWFFYRKLYKAGIILVVLFTSITFMTVKMQNELYDATLEMQSEMETIQQEYGNKADDEAAMKEAVEKQNAVIEKYTQKAANPFCILFSIIIAEHLLCGLIADPIYYKKMCRNLELIHQAQGDEMLKKSLVVRTGGTSLLAFAAGLMCGEALSYLMSFIADKITSSML